MPVCARSRIEMIVPPSGGALMGVNRKIVFQSLYVNKNDSKWL